MKLIRHYEIRIKDSGELVGKLPPDHDAEAEFAWVAALSPRVLLALYEITALGDAADITPPPHETPAVFWLPQRDS
jgi:hypothetical protein